MQARLSKFFLEHPEERITGNLVKVIQDPLKPLTEDGRLRINTALLILGPIVLFVVGAFLLFSFGQP